MGEEVAEQVGVDALDSGLLARRSTSDRMPGVPIAPRLPNHSASVSAAQRERGPAVHLRSSAVAVVAELARPRTATLADDVRHLLVKVDVVDIQVGQLGEPHTRVDEQAQHGVVPLVLDDLGPSHVARSGLICFSVSTGTGASGTLGGFIFAMGETVISPKSTRKVNRAVSAR